MKHGSFFVFIAINGKPSSNRGVLYKLSVPLKWVCWFANGLNRSATANAWLLKHTAPNFAALITRLSCYYNVHALLVIIDQFWEFFNMNIMFNLLQK